MTHFPLNPLLPVLPTVVFGRKMSCIDRAPIWKQNRNVFLRTKFFLDVVSIKVIVLLLALAHHLICIGAFDTL